MGRGGDGIAYRVTEVFVGESESFEGALKRFNKRVQAGRNPVRGRGRAEYYEEALGLVARRKEAARLRKLRKDAERAGQSPAPLTPARPGARPGPRRCW